MPCSSLEQYKEFQEECYSIALHPSGLYILVGFSDKLRLMNLLIDDIRSFKEFTIRGCREVSISIALSLWPNATLSRKGPSPESVALRVRERAGTGLQYQSEICEHRTCVFNAILTLRKCACAFFLTYYCRYTRVFEFVSLCYSRPIFLL